jgi:hypothetical protein
MKATADNFQRPKFEVSDIFRLYGKEYRTQNGMTKKQHTVMSAIENCRTSDYGFHVDQCNRCGHTEIDFNSCRDRHCPKCQGISRKKWVKKRLKEVLPVSYFHAVFTLPHLLHSLILYNRELIYDLLFSSSSETLLTFGRDPKWLGGEIGFYGILHSWGQTLWHHPHVHFIVPGGALTADNRWIEPKYKDKFLFPVHALSKVFRGKFIDGLKSAYYLGEVELPPDLADLSLPDNFESWIDDLVGRDWIVYCKPPFGNAEEVIRYIGRYTHRVAISNQRIVRVENDEVDFRYKDYKANTVVWQTMTLKAQEFIRRFLWHVLPKGFHKIRHYGFLANGRCKSKVAHIMSLLGTESIEDDCSMNDDFRIKCPECGQGKLYPMLIINRFTRIISDFVSFHKIGYAFDTS